MHFLGLILDYKEVCDQRTQAGHGSSIGCASAWYADGHRFDPHIQLNILLLRFGHEKILWPFSPFCWFKKGSCQLLAKEWALSTGKLPRKLAQEQYD